jgi:hypothetical protein
MRRTLALTASAAVVGALALAQTGAAGPGSLGAYFFGPKLVRAEVVLADDNGTLHDYRVDRGRIRSVDPGSVSVLERDGTVVAIPVADSAEVHVGARIVPAARLRRFVGALATTIRDGDQPASIVQVTR